jgi:hypothetical protein
VCAHCTRCWLKRGSRTTLSSNWMPASPW